MSEHIVSCFECGYKYDSKEHTKCDRCGETKIFQPEIHDPNYDVSRDPKALAKIRLGIFGFVIGFLILRFFL